MFSQSFPFARELRNTAGLLIALATLLPGSANASVVAPLPMEVPAPAESQALATVQSVRVAGLFGSPVEVQITVDAWVERGRERIPLSAGMRLHKDDRLVTRGAEVGLLLPGGGARVVDPGSLVVLHDIQDPTVTAFGRDADLPASRVSGEVARAEPVAPTEPVEVAQPVGAVAAVDAVDAVAVDAVAVDAVAVDAVAALSVVSHP